MSFNPRRFRIADNQWGDGFNVTDTTAGTTTQLSYNYVNTSSSGSFRSWEGSTHNGVDTWNFAPLCEQREVDPQGFIDFRQRLHTDDQFVADQLREQQRLGEPSRRAGPNLSLMGRIRQRIYDRRFRLEREDLETDEFELLDIYPNLLERFIMSSKWKAEVAQTRKENKARLEIKRRANANSLKLLKKYLTPNEYKDLIDDGLLKIQTGDETYLISKSPGATVKVIDKKGRTKGNFCLITEEMGYAIGDVLLTKIMMIKTDPNNFKRIAINRGL